MTPVTPTVPPWIPRPVDAEQATIGSLVGRLGSQAGTLIHQEFQLAKAELSNTAQAAARQVLVIGVGVLLTSTALMVLSGALVLVLATRMPPWQAAAVVGGALAVAALGFLFLGVRALRHLGLTPQQTITTMEETKSWAKALIR